MTVFLNFFSVSLRLCVPILHQQCRSGCRFADERDPRLARSAEILKNQSLATLTHERRDHEM